MARMIPWKQSLGARLAALAVLLLALTLVFLVISHFVVTMARNDSIWVSYAAGNRFRYMRALYLANRLADATDPAEKRRLRSEIDRIVQELDQRFDWMRQGDPALGIAAPTDPRIVEGNRSREEFWRKDIRPILTDRLGPTTTRAEVAGDLARLEELTNLQIGRIDRGIELARLVTVENLDRISRVNTAYAIAVALALLGELWVIRGVYRRTQDLLVAADRMAGGGFDANVPVTGSDELSILAAAFNAMAANLRTLIEDEKLRRKKVERLLGNIREAVTKLTSTTSEILASTAQQAAGAQEQAAAVAQTVTTVDQVTQTANQAAQRAKAVGETIQRTLEVGQAGRRTVEVSVASLNQLKSRVESTAADILRLAEQAQAIGEIIATVNDIAEQTNILALNAAIEASRAGEHGRGFAVVAGEVKALADQSKKATTQVRQILGEIQRATHTAVLSTEEVTKGVTDAIQAGGQSNQTINVLADTLNDAAQASAQIVASAGQQATGMAQIGQAMRNLDQVSRQNLLATRQVEQASQNLNTLGNELTGLAAE